jgi:ankyrin repeat protein
VNAHHSSHRRRLVCRISDKNAFHRVEPVVFQQISVQAAQALIRRRLPVIFDVRDEGAYRQARIPQSVHLTLQNIKTSLKKFRHDQPVLIYCYRGNASRDFAQLFADFGFQEVYSMDGGFEAWNESGADLERPPVPRAEVRSNPVLDWVLDQGGNPDDLNAPLHDGATLLITACRQGRSEIAEGLIEAGAAIGLADAYGNDALWAACYSGDLATVAALMDAGTDLNRRNPSGTTSLMYAASAGKTEVVAFLLEAGADPEIRNQDDFTALDLAANLDILKLLKRSRT